MLVTLVCLKAALAMGQGYIACRALWRGYNTGDYCSVFSTILVYFLGDRATTFKTPVTTVDIPKLD